MRGLICTGRGLLGIFRLKSRHIQFIALGGTIGTVSLSCFSYSMVVCKFEVDSVWYFVRVLSAIES